MHARSLALMLAALVLASAARAQEQGPVVFEEKGVASYYGEDFHGKKTASGEPFDQNAMTAAHPKLPLGTEVTVTNEATGKKVEVEINDRGPYADDREIDLSKGAARKLGITQQGVAEVKIEATKEQVEEAVDTPKEVPKVEAELKDARRAAAADGTPQPQPAPKLDPPAN
ncbi:MAG: septal ring lytic transglycosylase RlpA family protein [Geminicoccaceae bacterium]